LKEENKAFEASEESLQASLSAMTEKYDEQGALMQG